jgi:hypothetical protein
MKRRLLLKSVAVVLVGMLGLGLSARTSSAAPLNPCILGCCICTQDPGSDCNDEFCTLNCPQDPLWSSCAQVDDGSCGPDGPWWLVYCND